MKPVKAIDAAFLQLETPETPMHVGAVFVLAPADERARKGFYRRLKREIGQALGRSEVFTRRVAALPLNAANPMWIDDDVDLDYHLRRTTLPAPGSRLQLDSCIADLHSPPMDRSRPLWELHVVEGLEGGRVALYIKTHHAGLDGASAQQFLMSFAGTSPGPRQSRGLPVAAPAAERPDARELVGAALRHQSGEIARLPARLTAVAKGVAASLRGWPEALAAVLSRGLVAPRTPLNVAIDGERVFASVECSLDEVKRIAKSRDATVNDVVLAACAGALRRWLLLRNTLPERPLIAAVPVSTRAAGDTEHAIQVSFMSVDLHTDLDDPQLRLQAIRESAADAKTTAARMKAVLPPDLPSLGLPWLLGLLARIAGRRELVERVPLPANIVISNVAGPPVPLYVAGARAISYEPVSIPYHGCALNVTVYSYDGRMFFGLTAARGVLPDLREIADGLRRELADLGRGPARKSRHARPPRRRRGTAKR